VQGFKANNNHLSFWQPIYSVNPTLNRPLLYFIKSSNAFKSCISRLEIRPVVPTKIYKALQVIGFEGPFWFEVFLIKMRVFESFNPCIKKSNFAVPISLFKTQ